MPSLQAARDGGARAHLRPDRPRLGLHHADPSVPRPGPGHHRGGRRVRVVADPVSRRIRAAAVPHTVPADSERRPARDGELWRHGALSRAAVLVCWVLVYKAGMGSKGAALSNAISCCINLVILALYVWLSSACKNTWSGFSGEAFKELRQFAELAMPSAMMICLEWWSFEILVLLSGLLPNPQTSVLSICCNTGALLFMVPLGLCSSISTHVLNERDAGQPKAANLAMRVVMYMAFSEGLVITLTMVLLRNVWGYVYNNEQEVVTYIARMLPVLRISFFIDRLHSSLSGILTGCGKQKIGAAVNLGAFYLAGIPMAVILAFVFHLNGMCFQ